MNAEKIALDYLDTYSERYIDNIDPMMVPFKRLFTDNGYITLHSCSGHIKVSSISICKARYRKHNRWYLMFVDTKGIDTIKKVVKRINEKYQYELTLYEKIDHPVVVQAYVIEYVMSTKINNDMLYNINKNIYNEFKAEFEK